MSTVKCSCCGKKLHRSRAKVYKKNYCDVNCRLDEKIRWIGFVVANRSTMKSSEMAEHIGLTHSGFRTWIHIFNKHLKGYLRLVFRKVPKPKPPKTVRIKPPVVPRLPKNSPKVLTPQKKEIAAKSKEKTERRNNEGNWALFPLIGTRNIRIAENERLGKVAVKVNQRTTIFVYPHDIEAVRLKYGLIA